MMPITTLSKDSVSALRDMKRKSEAHARPAPRIVENAQLDWRWGIVQGAVAIGGGQFNAVFNGGATTFREWLGVELRYPNGDNLTPYLTGSIGSIGGGGASPTLITCNNHGLVNGQYIIITATPSAALDGIYRVANATANTFSLQGTPAMSLTVADGADVKATATGTGNWTVGLPVANRDPACAGSAGVICKAEYGYGEWSLKWVGC